MESSSAARESAAAAAAASSCVFADSSAAAAIAWGLVEVAVGRSVVSLSTFGARRRRNLSQSFQARSEARLDFDIVESHSMAFLAALDTVDFFSGTCCALKASSSRSTVVACIR